jgi:hypothetical protein
MKKMSYKMARVKINSKCDLLNLINMIYKIILNQKYFVIRIDLLNTFKLYKPKVLGPM